MTCAFVRRGPVERRVDLRCSDMGVVDAMMGIVAGGILVLGLRLLLWFARG